MKVEQFRDKYPEIYDAVTAEAEKTGYDKGFEAGEIAGIEKGKAEGIAEGKEEGARTERERIRNVEAQFIPGHEKLINTLKFDGMTTGEQAAVKILQAEKELRTTVSKQLIADAPMAVVPVAAPEVEMNEKTIQNLPIEKRAEIEWNRRPDLRSEFLDDFDGYLAFLKAEAKGRVKILHKSR